VTTQPTERLASGDLSTLLSVQRRVRLQILCLNDRSTGTCIILTSDRRSTEMAAYEVLQSGTWNFPQVVDTTRATILLQPEAEPPHCQCVFRIGRGRLPWKNLPYQCVGRFDRRVDDGLDLCHTGCFYERDNRKMMGPSSSSLDVPGTNSINLEIATLQDNSPFHSVHDA
jgi:hypothetical protein